MVAALEIPSLVVYSCGCEVGQSCSPRDGKMTLGCFGASSRDAPTIELPESRVLLLLQHMDQGSVNEGSLPVLMKSPCPSGMDKGSL